MSNRRCGVVPGRRVPAPAVVSTIEWRGVRWRGGAGSGSSPWRESDVFSPLERLARSATSFGESDGEGEERCAPPLPRLLWAGRRQFTGGGASLLHRERTRTQRGVPPIGCIDDGDVLRPKVFGVEYGADDRREAERTVGSNRPPRVQRPIHYPRRYLVLDVDVDDHTRRVTRARDGVRGRVQNQARGGRAFVGGSSPCPSRQGGAGSQC